MSFLYNVQFNGKNQSFTILTDSNFYMIYSDGYYLNDLFDLAEPSSTQKAQKFQLKFKGYKKIRALY